MGKNQSGFTLIEVTLVLTIIGLLLFGMLKGTALVHQAKVRKTAQMVEDIRTASNLFYREQGRLPGDGPILIINTSGVLDGLIKPTGQGTEPEQFRRELIAGRYLTGKYTSTTADKWQNPLGGEVSVEYRSAPVALNYIVVTGISVVEDQKFLDLQFDDGEPATGNVRYVAASKELLIPL